MSDQSVKVGDIVFAADLVKVQKGTKYCTITYFDLDSLNIVEKHRAHRAFELLSTDYEGFQYWNINNVSVQNNALIEEGLIADTSAYMHANNEFSVTYYNYNQKPKYVVNEQEKNYNTCSNDIYLSNCNGQLNVLRTVVDYELTANSFLLSTYRFIGWKKDDYGQLLLPYDKLILQDNTNYYAQWLKQYWLDINVNDLRFGQTKLINYVYSDIKAKYGNYYDVSSLMILSACPIDHYHFISHIVSYIDINENTPQITSFNITELSNGTVQLQLSNNIQVNSVYGIDKFNISFNVNTNNVGIVKLAIGTDKYSNNTHEILTVLKDWNTQIFLETDRTDRTKKFLKWEGNVPSKYIYSMAFTTYLTNDISATAVYEKTNIYSVLVYTNNIKFGTVSTNRDPETPQLQNGIYVLPDRGKTFDVIVTAKPKNNCQFVCMKDNYGTVYNNISATLTKFISKNYQVTAYFDTELIDNNFEPIVDDNAINIDDTFATITSDIIKDTTYLERCYEYPDKLLSSNTLIIMQNHIVSGDEDKFEHTCNEIIPIVKYTDTNGNVTELFKDKNYTLTYENNNVNWVNIEKGEVRTLTAKAIIEGIGMYSGLVSLEFIILYTRNNDELI